MICRGFVLGILVSSLLVGHWRNASAGHQFQSVGFELSGTAASISPDEFNAVFEDIGFEPIDRAYGLSVGVFADISQSLRLIGTVGYMRGSTDNEDIFVFDQEGKLIATTYCCYSTASIPVGIGCGYRFVRGGVALVLSMAGEMHIVSVKGETATSGEFEGYEERSSATGAGIRATVGAEWRVANASWIGVRGGYRLANADLPYPNAPSLGDMEMDLSGIIVAAYVTVQPWTSGSQQVK